LCAEELGADLYGAGVSGEPANGKRHEGAAHLKRRAADELPLAKLLFEFGFREHARGRRILGMRHQCRRGPDGEPPGGIARAELLKSFAVSLNSLLNDAFGSDTWVAADVSGAGEAGTTAAASLADDAGSATIWAAAGVAANHAAVASQPSVFLFIGLLSAARRRARA
jgi:hypothetical protein